jgi:hypothetical protein
MSTQTVYPIGAKAAHHMPEDYYLRWDALRTAERRSWREMLAGKVSGEAWQRAAGRLAAHENAHNTH